METIGFFMIGLPGDTEATMDETIRLACAGPSWKKAFQAVDRRERRRATGGEDYPFFTRVFRDKMIFRAIQRSNRTSMWRVRICPARN